MANDLFPEKLTQAMEWRGGGYPLLVQLLAAAGVPMGKSRLAELARRAGLRATGDRPYYPDSLAAEIELWIKAGLVRRTDTGFECAHEHRFAAFREAALAGRLGDWRAALWRAFNISRSFTWYYPRSTHEAVALIRIALLSGIEGEELRTSLQWTQNQDLGRLYVSAFGEPFDPEVFELVAPALRDQVAEWLLAWMLYRPVPSAPKLIEWAEQRSGDADAPSPLRWAAYEHLLWQDRFDEALVRLGENRDGFALALKGAAAAMRREPAKSGELYAAALTALRKTDRRKAGHLRFSVAWLRAAALITTGTPAALEEARRYARAEARASGRWGDWGWNRLESVAEVLLGDRQPETLSLAPNGEHALDDLLTLEMRAWLNLKLDRKGEAAAQRSREAFAQSGYAWAAREIEAAIAILTGSASSAPFANTLAAALASQAQWRRALAAIAALSDAERSAAPETRLAWMVKTELSHGRIAVEPWEQKRGPRGWSKGKQVALSRLAKSDRLAARDAQVCRALRQLSGKLYEIDVDRALPALVGHPLVFFDDDFSTPVELVAADPQLAIRHSKNGVRVTVPSDLRKTLGRREQTEYWYESRAEKKADPCVLVRETATRASVIRVTAAHRRVAELIGAGLEVPSEGADELKHAVESLTSFFAVHSDVEAGVPEVAADPTIRAELAPAGEGLRLRLAVRPFGEQGPRHAPGEGGARLISEVAGERRAAARDLADERRRADDVLEALPMLGDDSGAFEWRIDDPEDCLALLEALQSLGDTLRVEWPAGAKFHVTRPYGAADLKLAIRASRDWFVASGGLQLDDGMVLDMARLIEFARKSRGRYLPLGEGGFVALTEELKRRIEELAGTGEVAEQGLRVHPLAAQAINEIAAGATIESDGEWCVRLDRIRESETLEPEVPSTLQAELRPYQYEGYRWLARLAHWGAGACLADDMGLGKTVQALACLLKRAPEGAALVIAPTSVCQNWIDEARRFTPTLRCHLFGAGDRQRLVAEAEAFDLIVCSYALLQQELDLFTGRAWHTLVLDEAQAVKNFATKRAQAVLALSADFRMVTTGTPVENRLDELWMLFRFLNPGLLGSRERFNERFAGPIERNRDARARARLRRLTRPFVLRRTKSEVLAELPERTEITLAIEPDERELAFHEALRLSALAAIEGGGIPLEQRRFQVLAELMRLRRACCDPRLVAPEGALVGSKLEAFTLLIEELTANRHKALVFSQFVDYLALLRGELDRMGVRYQYLDGATPAAERAKRVAAFQAGVGDLFLISLRAGGFGLNLTAADYVIIADPWWNPAVEDQAAARAHRMGQERPVTVYRLVMKGSIEERIMELHRDKRALAEGLFAGDEFGGAVSVEELVRLLREG